MERQMDIESTPPFIYQGKIEQACYREQKVPSFQGNPLIEALPPLLEKEEVFKRMRISPVYEEQHRHYSLEERLLLLGHGRRFFEPMSMHFDLARRLGSMLRDGYVGRNPLMLGYYRESREKLDKMIQEPLACDLPLGFNLGLTMMGISGIGKSRALERASSLYPQIIQHHQYKDRRFTRTQLVWFKLDCPHDGSILGLCTNFFRQVDMVLGTNYFQNYGIKNKPSQNAMVGYMTTVAFNHSLGVLIIDEIQNLKRTKDPGMLDFFVQLDNEIGVPVVLVGTPDAEDILSGDLRRARRASGQGDMRWSRMQNDVEWRYFLKSLWHYRYVQKQSELNEELIQTMYFESQGITDFAIKLYFLAQRYAIATKEETITRETIQKAARMGLNMVQPFLNYLRTNDTKKIRTYGNLPSQDIEAKFQQVELELTKHINPVPMPETATSDGKQSPSKVIQETGVGQDESHKGLSTSLATTTQEQRGYETLPQIVAQGLKKQKIAAYEALKQASCIFNAVEYLIGEDVQ
jgi:hypothetical protein